MIFYDQYIKHQKNIYVSNGIIYDDTIYTFDIETTSVVLYQNRTYNSDFYDTLSTKEKKEAQVYGFMYIWMFSIDGIVYYGRTWEQFKIFYKKVFNDTKIHSFVYVHNLAMECQFLRGILSITKVFARQKYKPIYFENHNVTFRCSYQLTGVKLERLPTMYNLPVEKKVGDLDYKLIRHEKTTLSEKELSYCENDCLVLHELIRYFRTEYEHIKKIPLTRTGILRRKTKKELRKSKSFKLKMSDLVSDDLDLYDLQVRSFAGGYVHANAFLAGEILENVDSWDKCSSYPFQMCCEKVFPQQAFKECTYITIDNMQYNFIYLIDIVFYEIKSIKENTIISFSKCFNIGQKHVCDNGRILYAEKVEMCITNFDYEIIKKFYTWEKSEVKKMYYSPRGYLPKDFINFILTLYEKKTKLKNVKGKEVEYGIYKSDFNSLYGMCVTNNIRDEVVYNDTWEIRSLTQTEIKEKILEENNKKFLHFSYGVFITSIARFNLLNLVYENDTFNIYSDTDSMKLKKGYNKSIIHRDNQQTIKKIIAVKKALGLKGFLQKDIYGNSHILGLWEYEETYKKFKTLGSKKYCYIDNVDKLNITIAGVPKKGANCLRSIEDFQNNTIFSSDITGKLQLFYSEEKNVILTVTDYTGVESDVKFSYGIGFVPCSYTLQESFFKGGLSDNITIRRLYE